MSSLDRRYLLVGLLFIIFASRIIGLASYPAFIDETIHIDSASKLLEISPLYNVHIGRTLTIWWYALFQPQQADPIWIARMATVIISMLGIAMMLRLSQQMTDSSNAYASLLMALFILFSPYHYFFERLALADSVAASFVLVAIGIGYRLRNRVNFQDAVLCGGCLALGILAKVNVLPYAGVVLAVPVAFAFRHALGRIVQWFGVALTSLIMPILAFEILVRLTGNGWLGAIFNYVDARTHSSNFLANGIENILQTGEWLFAYMHPLIALTLLISAVVLIIQRRWYLTLVTLAPMLPMWFTDPQQSRYWLIPVMLLGLALSVTITELVSNQKSKTRWSQAIPVVALIIWGSVIWVPQALTTLYNPVNVQIPYDERGQYVRSDAIAFGFAEIADIIPDSDSDTEIRILGLVANCHGLRYTFWDSYTVLCTTMNPSGSDIPALLQWVESERGALTYVVLEDVPFVPETIQGDLLGVIEHESERPRLRIYEIDS